MVWASDSCVIVVVRVKAREVVSLVAVFPKSPMIATISQLSLADYTQNQFLFFVNTQGVLGISFMCHSSGACKKREKWCPFWLFSPNRRLANFTEFRINEYGKVKLESG